MPDADADPVAGLAEGDDGVVGEDAVEEEQDPEEVAVDVLQDQGEPGLAAVAAVGVGHRAGRRRQPEGAVVGLAVVVAGEAEAEREDQDQQRRRVVPEGQRPEGVAARHAAVGDAGGVEGRDQVPVQVRPGVVVLADEGRPGRVDDEGDQHHEGETGSTHQLSLRRVGWSGPPRGAPMATGVGVGFSTVVVTRASSVPGSAVQAGKSFQTTPATVAIARAAGGDPTAPLTRHVKDIKSIKIRAIGSESDAAAPVGLRPGGGRGAELHPGRRPPAPGAALAVPPGPAARARARAWSSSTGARARGRVTLTPDGSALAARSCSASWPTSRRPGPRRGRSRAWPGAGSPSAPRRA